MEFGRFKMDMRDCLSKDLLLVETQAKFGSSLRLLMLNEDGI